jgi:D-psicose/D-tagatose/L-ribulose 3-epimerase
MTLSIEPVNRAESFFLRTAAEGRELCHDIAHPRVGITIDTFHANIEEKSIPEALVTLGSYLKHLHISENDRGLLGTGHVPFPEIIKALDQIGYEGYLMIEGFGFLQMNRMLREHYGQIPTCLPNPLPCKGSRIYRH